MCGPPTSHRDVGCPRGNLTPKGSRLQFPDRRHSPLVIMPEGGAGRRVSTECPRRHRDGWRVIESIVCPPATCGRVTAGESSKSSGLLDNSTTCQKPVTAHHGRVEESIWALVETYSQKAPEGPCRVKRRGSGGVPSELDIDRTAASPLGGATRMYVGEFDPGSGRTLAACLMHASRATHEGG